MTTGILSYIRSEIATTLMKKYGFSQSETAKLLGVSQPAVSQYIRNIRGNKNFINDDEVRKSIDELAKKIAEKKPGGCEILKDFCNICKLIRKKGLVCKIHRSSYSLSGCSLCYE